MSTVFRAYIPTVKFARNQLTQVAPALLLPTCCNVTVDTALVHRKIWCWIWSNAGGWAIDFDLVASLNGAEVYRQKMSTWTTAATLNKWYSGLTAWNAGASVGATSEQVFTWIGGALFVACPVRLNLTCDKVFLGVNTATDLGGAAFDAAIFVQSQMGI